MAAKTKQQSVEWKADPLEPKTVFVGEEEVYDATVLAEHPGEGEVSLHVTQEGADAPASSLYLTPTQALLLADRLRFAAWLAERSGEQS